MAFVPRFIFGDLDLTEYPFSVEFGATFGAPENASDVIESLLADGEIIDGTRSSNRELTIPILIEGSDLAEIAESQALLEREARKAQNTLAFHPGDDIGAPTVFDTFRAAMTFGEHDDGDRAGLRRFVLTIPALPFARGESMISTAATAVPSVGVTIDNCESTASFTWLPSPTSTDTLTPVTPFAVDSSVFIEGAGSMAVQPNYGKTTPHGPGVNGGARYYYRWHVDLDESPAAGSYLSFAFRASAYVAGTDARNGLVSFWVTTDEDGEVLYDVGSVGGAGDVIVQVVEEGFTRYSVRLNDGVHLTRLRFYAWQDDPSPVGSEPHPAVRVDQIALAESATLGSQVLKIVNVGGSARTTGSLHVAAPTDAVGLGQVALFSVARDRVRDGFLPNLRQWDDGTGATTVDADATNGSYYTTLGTSETYADASPALLVPASMFNSTAHTMVARLTSPAAEGTALYLGVQAQLVVDGVEVGEPVSVQRDWADPGVAGYEMVPLGSLYLPPLPIEAATPGAVVRFRFRGNIYLDELYAFPVDGDLSIIDCGAGTAGPAVSSHLWVDSPSQTQPQGGYWRGETADRVNAISAWSVANVPGTHHFDPGDVLVFAAATGASGPTVDLTHYERVLFHAPR